MLSRYVLPDVLVVRGNVEIIVAGDCLTLCMWSQQLLRPKTSGWCYSNRDSFLHAQLVVAIRLGTASRSLPSLVTRLVMIIRLSLNVY